MGIISPWPLLPQLGNVSRVGILRWQLSNHLQRPNHFLNLGQFGARSFVFYSCFHMPTICSLHFVELGELGELATTQMLRSYLYHQPVHRLLVGNLGTSAV